MNWLKIMFGNLLFTTTYAFIAVPKGIVNGGVTSFAMVLGKLTGLNIALLTNIMLLLLLCSCLVFLSRAYFWNALFSGVCYMVMFPFFYHLGYEADLPFVVSVPLAAAIVGLGYYFCIAAQASSVGFDTVGIILNKKNPRIATALVMYICNAAVLLLGFFTYGWTAVAAGLIFAAIQSLTLHFLLKKFPQRDRQAERAADKKEY